MTVQFTSTASQTFADLGTGTVYATASYTGLDNFTVIPVDLNSPALAVLAAGGVFEISGRLVSPEIFAPDAPDQFAYGISQGLTTQLLLTSGVPEPATWALMLVSVAALGSTIRPPSVVRHHLIVSAPAN